MSLAQQRMDDLETSLCQAPPRSGMDWDGKTPDGRLVEQVLAGDPAARTELVDRLTTIIRSQANLGLRGFSDRRMGGRDADDLVNEVFAAMFEDGGAALRKYDPQYSLEQFAYVFAKSRILDIARKEYRRLELGGHPVADDEHQLRGHLPTPAELTECRDFANRIMACVRAKFSTELAGEMIDLTLVRQLSTDEIQSRTGMTRQQVFRWRSRLLQQARSCWRKIAEDDS